MMQTAKEFQEQLEWFWLFCQEEAWWDDQEEWSRIMDQEWDLWEAHW